MFTSIMLLHLAIFGGHIRRLNSQMYQNVVHIFQASEPNKQLKWECCNVDDRKMNVTRKKMDFVLRACV